MRETNNLRMKGGISMKNKIMSFLMIFVAAFVVGIGFVNAEKRISNLISITDAEGDAGEVTYKLKLHANIDLTNENARLEFTGYKCNEKPCSNISQYQKTDNVINFADKDKKVFKAGEEITLNFTVFSSSTNENYLNAIMATVVDADGVGDEVLFNSSDYIDDLKIIYNKEIWPTFDQKLIKNLETSLGRDGADLSFTVNENLDLSKGAKIMASYYKCNSYDWVNDDYHTSDKCSKVEVKDFYVNSKPLQENSIIKVGDSISFGYNVYNETNFYGWGYSFTVLREDGSGYVYEPDMNGSQLRKVTSIAPANPQKPVNPSKFDQNLIKNFESSFGRDGADLSFTVNEDLDLSKGAKISASVYICKAGYSDENEDYHTSDKCYKDEIKDINLNLKPLQENSIIKAGDKIYIDYCGNGSTFYSGRGYSFTVLREDGSGYVYEPDMGSDEFKNVTTIKPVVPVVEDKVVVIPEDKKVTKDMFEQMIKDKNKVTYEAKENDKLIYSWTFDGASMTSSEYDINLEVNVGSSSKEAAIRKLIPNTKDTPLYVEFTHHGALPKNTTVKVNTQGKYKDGESLTLYYFNEETKELEEIAKGLVVSNGYVDLALEHCSNYVLVKDNKALNNAQTSSLNVLLYIGMAIASVAGIVYIIIKKKEA